MTLLDRRVPGSIAISISESADLGVFGLAECHLREAMAEFATHLLSLGASLAYGGDLRAGGFTRLLFELVWRYRRRIDESPPVVNYLAWPVHIRMEVAQLTVLQAEIEDIAQLAILGEDGNRITIEERAVLPRHEPDDREWEVGLTAMRKAMCAEAAVRILLGGRVENYKGRMPGIAEEAFLSLRSGQPTFLVGGFGGCTRDIAEDLGLVSRWAGSRPAWRGRVRFEDFSEESLANGLSTDENRLLASTSHVEEAVTLVLRGLYRLYVMQNKPKGADRNGR